MSTSRRCPRHARWVLSATALCVSALLTACGTLNPKSQVVEETRVLRKGPESAPERMITGFSDGLRCMDSIFLVYGVRDISVMVEDIADQTKKVNAGTKDMLISAVSDMTRRSRAVRLMVYGTDSGNAIGYLRETPRRNILYTIVPQYDIKGSVSQFDESLVRRQDEAGIALGNALSIGGGRSSATSVLGIDLSVLATEDLSVVPGVTSRNSVVIFKSGSGLESDATIKKLGANFGMSLSKAEGQTQALRTLVELGAIELLGKLTHTPYWSCLHADPSGDAVKDEISDWFQAMLARPPELVSWFQLQLRLRGYYSGPVDGVPNVALKDAVSAYRSALGLPANAKLDVEFFGAYLNADHAAVLAKFPPTPVAKEAIAPPPPPLVLTVATANRSSHFKAGETIDIVATVNRDAFVYCYWQDESHTITRIFPNRFVREPRLAANTPLELPGRMKFQLFANDRHASEKIACYATERDVIADLPGAVRGTDFEALQGNSLDEIGAAFAGASRGTAAVASVALQAD